MNAVEACCGNACDSAATSPTWPVAMLTDVKQDPFDNGIIKPCFTDSCVHYAPSDFLQAANHSLLLLHSIHC